MDARMTMAGIAALIAVSVLVAGCGSDDSTGATVNTTLTVSSLNKKQFIKKTDDICYGGKTRMTGQLQTYMRNHPELPRSDSGVEAVTTILVPSVEEQLPKLRALGAPAGDEREIEEMWNGLEESIEEIKDEEISANSEIREAFLPNGQRIFAYGMRGCAYGR